MEPLERILDIQAIIAEHCVKTPELVAVHYADYAALSNSGQFTFVGTGGLKKGDPLFGTVGPVIVPDIHVKRGTAEAWDSASGYRKHYEAREKRMRSRHDPAP